MYELIRKFDRFGIFQPKESPLNDERKAILDKLKLNNGSCKVTELWSAIPGRPELCVLALWELVDDGLVTYGADAVVRLV